MRKNKREKDNSKEKKDRKITREKKTTVPSSEPENEASRVLCGIAKFFKRTGNKRNKEQRWGKNRPPLDLSVDPGTQFDPMAHVVDRLRYLEQPQRSQRRNNTRLKCWWFYFPFFLNFIFFWYIFLLLSPLFFSLFSSRDLSPCFLLLL